MFICGLLNWRLFKESWIFIVQCEGCKRVNAAWAKCVRAMGDMICSAMVDLATKTRFISVSRMFWSFYFSCINHVIHLHGKENKTRFCYITLVWCDESLQTVHRANTAGCCASFGGRTVITRVWDGASFSATNSDTLSASMDIICFPHDFYILNVCIHLV